MAPYDGRSRRMQAAAGLASGGNPLFRTIAAIRVRPRWSRPETKGLHHECQPRLRCIRRGLPRHRRRQGTPALVAPAAAPDPVRERERVPVGSLDRFDVYRVSLLACRASAPVAASLNANLRDQLLRASSSVVLNVAEGFGSASRGVKRRHYEIARGSAVECIAVLDLASVIGGGDGSGCGSGPGVGEARELFTRASMMLARLGGRFR